MVKVTYNGRELLIPAELCELTPRQYIAYSLLAHKLSMEIIDPEQWRVEWVSRLLGLKYPYTFLRPEIITEIEVFAKSVADGFLDEDGVPDFDTEVNLLPEYEGYHGPGDWLEGVTFGEFTQALTHLEGIDPEGDGIEEAFDGIARILYHIPTDKEVPVILAVHAPRLLSAVWRSILREPVELNGRKVDLRIIFRHSDGAPQRKDDNTGWAGITFEVAQAGLFGTVKEVERAPMWEVLMYLYKCKFEYNNELKPKQ